MCLSLVVNVSYAGLGDWLKEKGNQFGNWVVSVPKTVSTAVNTVVCNEYMGGPEKVCSGVNEIYYIGKKQYQSITWTTSSTSNIKSINGVDIEVLKAKYRQLLGLPSNFPVRLETFYLNTQNLFVNFTGSLTNDVVISAGANASAQATYNGTTVNLTGLQVGANASVSTTTKISTGLQLTATNITGGDPGSSISVSFDGTSTSASVSVQATTSVLNPCGNVFIQKNINVIPTPIAPVIIGVPTNGVTCNSQVRLSTPFQNNVNYQWATEDAKFYNPQNMQLPNFYSGSSVNIGGFTSEGTKSVFLGAYNSCGNVVSSVLIQVLSPQIEVKADQVVIGASFTPTCSQATDGLNLAAEPWVSASAVYSWDIPAGWVFEGSLNVSTFTMVNGMVKYTYAGNNLRNPRLKRVSPNAPNGIITISVTNVCGPNSTITKAITLVSPQNIDISLPTSIVSCNSAVSISPILATTGTYPYKVVWSTAGLEGQFATSANQTLTSGALKNTFNASKYGNGSVSVRVTDARGCICLYCRIKMGSWCK